MNIEKIKALKAFEIKDVFGNLEDPENSENCREVILSKISTFIV